MRAQFTVKNRRAEQTQQMGENPMAIRTQQTGVNLGTKVICFHTPTSREAKARAGSTHPNQDEKMIRWMFSRYWIMRQTWGIHLIEGVIKNDLNSRPPKIDKTYVVQSQPWKKMTWSWLHQPLDHLLTKSYTSKATGRVQTSDYQGLWWKIWPLRSSWPLQWHHGITSGFRIGKV